MSISDTLLSRLSEIIAVRMGLFFPEERWGDLARGITSAAREFDFKDVESCIGWLMSSSFTKSRIEVLASHLTIGETYFFREKQCLDLLEEHVLPELMRARQCEAKALRIWTAGCSTGEEAYSVACMLYKMIPDLNDWNVTILATDINPHALRKASRGVYGKWSFRDVQASTQERYFKKRRNGNFEVLSHIKKMVTFAFHNLVEDDYPSLTNNTNAMDIIFCRNVLMYFAPEQARKVVQNLYRCLETGGWLVTGVCETSNAVFSEFTAVSFADTALYRKGTEKAQTARELYSTAFVFSPADESADPFQLPLDYVGETVFEPPAPEGPIAYEINEPRAAEQRPINNAPAFYEPGLYAEAAQTAADRLSPSHDDGPAMALLARTFANQGKLSEAMEWCEKAISADKLNPGHHYLIATIMQELEQFEEAERSLKRALYIDQDLVLAHFALGNMARMQGKFKEAEKHFKNALSLLRAYRPGDIIPESEGITAGRLVEVIGSALQEEAST